MSVTTQADLADAWLLAELLVDALHPTTEVPNRGLATAGSKHQIERIVALLANPAHAWLLVKLNPALALKAAS